MRLFGFSFQPCENSNSTVSFGSVNNARDQTHGTAQTPIYTRVNTLPSSANIRIPCPRRPGATQDHEVLDVAITYKIRAVISRNQEGINKTVAETCTEIWILDDSLDVQPPTCIADFGWEYHSHQRATLCASKIAVLKQIVRPQQDSSPAIFVRASEPRPLLLRKTSQYATTNAPLKLGFQTDQSAPDNGIDLTRGTIGISWRLQKSTFCAFKGLKKVPTLRQVSSVVKPTTVQRKVTLSDRHTYKHDLAVCEWQHDVDVGQLTQPESDSAHENLLNLRASSPEQATSDLTLVPFPEKVHLDNDNSGNEFVQHNAQGCRSPSPPYTETAPDPIPSEQFAINGTTIHIPTLSTSIPVPIHISRDLLPAPTSFTPYIAVRYSLQIHVVMSLYPSKGSHANNGRVSPASATPKRKWHRRLSSTGSGDRWMTEAHLDVPVQIVYDSSPFALDGDYSATFICSLEPVCETNMERATEDTRQQNFQQDMVVETLPSYSR